MQSVCSKHSQLFDWKTFASLIIYIADNIIIIIEWTGWAFATLCHDSRWQQLLSIHIRALHSCHSDTTLDSGARWSLRSTTDTNLLRRRRFTNHVTQLCCAVMGKLQSANSYYAPAVIIIIVIIAMTMFMVLSSWPKSLREFTRFIW